MKVILLRDVAKIGKRSTIVEVPDGYALNQLIPKKWAEPATPHNVKRINNLKAGSEATDLLDAQQYETALSAINQLPLSVTWDANEQGHLFKAVHAEDIVAAASARSIRLMADHLVIETPIKSLGIHQVGLRRGTQVKTFPIEIIKK
jgi:large subunit ribosomal protein L9